MFWLAFLVPPAAALGPTGYPWQGYVGVPTTTAHAQPDANSKALRSLPSHFWLAVTGESGDWYKTSKGYVLKSDVVRDREEWIGELSHRVRVLHKPNSRSWANSTGHTGQLVRVVGVAQGVPMKIGGKPDPNAYWATTIGYVPLDAIRNTGNPWSLKWKLPTPEQAQSGWWARPEHVTNVRAGPSTDAPIVGRFDGSERIKILAEVKGKPVRGNATWYEIDGGQFAGAFVHSSMVHKIAPPKANTTAPKGQTEGTWIVVDRKARSLTLVKNGKATFTTYVAIGKAATETPDGEYSTFAKVLYDTMASFTTTADATYYVPNVPWTQYYKTGGYAIHGTYWHDHFGIGTSQGCVNMTETDAAYVFSQTAPAIGNQTQAWDFTNATTVIIVN